MRLWPGGGRDAAPPKMRCSSCGAPLPPLPALERLRLLAPLLIVNVLLLLAAFAIAFRGRVPLPPSWSLDDASTRYWPRFLDEATTEKAPTSTKPPSKPTKTPKKTTKTSLPDNTPTQGEELVLKGGVRCPGASRYGSGPPKNCERPTDPLKKPPSALEKWFTRDVFEDLFPKANLGWGPHHCFPYSYDAFVIAARYFPEFGTSSPNEVYKPHENHRRDLAAFFAHAVQETGENNAGLYGSGRNVTKAHECFYRGGFYNWFEGGPISPFMPKDAPGYNVTDGERCTKGGKYCAESAELNFFYKCNQRPAPSSSSKENLTTGCYFGRGAIQISYNYNYGLFQDWLAEQGIEVDLLRHPNLIMSKMDPPLAILASLWFYMTPQPPKPAMHDIVMGDWNSGEVNKEAGYSGPIFGPTSLIINNECNGEDAAEPGGPGESRRIKAFRWFTGYFGVPLTDDNRTLSCNDMPVQLDGIRYDYSYQPDWGSTWKADAPCNCAPAGYGGVIPYFDESFYPTRFVALNDANRRRCVRSVYANPAMYSMNNRTSACLNVPEPGEDDDASDHEAERNGTDNWYH